MKLFNRKILARHAKSAPLPANHLAALDARAETIRAGQIDSLTETVLHGQVASMIIDDVRGDRRLAGGAGCAVATERTMMPGAVICARNLRLIDVSRKS